MTDMALVGDIGGTNARFALADLDTLAVHDFVVAPNREHGSLAEVARDYLARLGARPRLGAIAVAGPVTGDDFKFTNAPWSFNRQTLCGHIGLDELSVLNDFEALALSLPHLGGDDVVQIGGAEPEPGRVKAVVGPGTGLGVAGLAPFGNAWQALPGEGGHVALAAEAADEFALLQRVGQEAGGRVSAERVLSGPGLETLFRALTGRTGMSAADIVAGAGRADPACRDALDRFVVWLGRFCGDVALTMGARGGLYLGGGIAPRIRKLLEAGAFRAAFDAKGRLSDFVRPIPIYLITTDDAPLRGAAASLLATR